MAKITIDWSEVKTTSKGKEYKVVSFKDESGSEVKASAWSDAPFYTQIAPGAEIEAEVKKSPDGKYTNLVGANTGSRGAGIQAMKTAQIEHAMDKKAQQIAVAQDRSAWMWAKTNASTLIANNENYRAYPIHKIADEVIELATKIYNGEPLVPFND